MSAGNLSAGSRLQGYGAPDMHERVSRIIRRRSTNEQDIREAALEGRDLSRVRRLLDVGCGYGFLAEALARRLPAEAQVTGVDAWEENREPFLARLTAAGRAGEFVSLEVDRLLPWPENHFDLVVSSFSLYFFPEAIEDVARVLTPSGAFLVLTHSEAAVRALLRAAGLPESGPLLDLVRAFSGESGDSVLARWFGRVEKHDYLNELVFSPENREELLFYLRFKLRLMVDCGGEGEAPCAPLEEELRERMTARLAQGSLRLPKDDAFLWASEPSKES